MGSSLSSMSAQSCLQQQRDAYPYMFHHDPLSHLASASYGRSCGATQSAQSHMGSYGSSITSSGGSQGAGMFNFMTHLRGCVTNCEPQSVVLLDLLSLT